MSDEMSSENNSRNCEPTNVYKFNDNLDKVNTIFERGGALGLKPEGIGKIANLFGGTTIGKMKDNQEDAILLATNGDVKLAMVADGIGGLEYGEVASSKAVLLTKKWFEGLENPEQYNMNPKALEASWKDIIFNIAVDISQTISSMEPEEQKKER